MADDGLPAGTPFLCYFAEHVHLATSTAWTFSAFVAANVASAALVSSNPTNLLIANVSFLCAALLAIKFGILTDVDPVVVDRRSSSTSSPVTQPTLYSPV